MKSRSTPSLSQLVRRGPRTGMFLAFMDQAFVSATNLGLSLAVGRWSGPTELGAVFVGFSVYLVIFALARALFGEPLSIHVAQSEPPSSQRHNLMPMILFGLAGSLSMGAAGVLTEGAVRQGLYLFAPWVPLALVQDLCRQLLFAERRGYAALLNDVCRFACFLAGVVAAGLASRPGWLVPAWGIGAAVSAFWGITQTRLSVRRGGPLLLQRAPWFGFQGLAYAVGWQALVPLLAVELSSAELGGWRAVQTVFGPLSLVDQSVSVVGLPAAARLVDDPARLNRQSIVLSAVAFGLCALYVAPFILVGAGLLAPLFGDAFREFDDLILPTAVAQIALAASIGFSVNLKATRRGVALFAAVSVGATATLVMSWVGARSAGVEGAAWGYAAAALTTTSAIATAVRLASRRNVS